MRFGWDRLRCKLCQVTAAGIQATAHCLRGLCKYGRTRNPKSRRTQLTCALVPEPRCVIRRTMLDAARYFSNGLEPCCQSCTTIRSFTVAYCASARCSAVQTCTGLRASVEPRSWAALVHVLVRTHVTGPSLPCAVFHEEWHALTTPVHLGHTSTDLVMQMRALPCTKRYHVAKRRQRTTQWDAS